MATNEIIGGRKMTREELIKKTEQLCDLYLELKKEGVYGIMHFIGEGVRIQCKRHTLAKYAGDIPTETRKRDCKAYPTETFVEFDKFTAFTLNKEEEQ
jgi:hypothetical protein